MRGRCMGGANASSSPAITMPPPRSGVIGVLARSANEPGPGCGVGGSVTGAGVSSSGVADALVVGPAVAALGAWVGTGCPPCSRGPSDRGPPSGVGAATGSCDVVPDARPGTSPGVLGTVGAVTGGTITGGAVSGGEVLGGEIPGGALTGGALIGGEVTGGEVTDGSVPGGCVTGGEVVPGSAAWPSTTNVRTPSAWPGSFSRHPMPALFGLSMAVYVRVGSS